MPDRVAGSLYPETDLDPIKLLLELQDLKVPGCHLPLSFRQLGQQPLRSPLCRILLPVGLVLNVTQLASAL